MGNCLVNVTPLLLVKMQTYCRPAFHTHAKADQSTSMGQSLYGLPNYSSFIAVDIELDRLILFLMKISRRQTIDIVVSEIVK